MKVSVIVYIEGITKIGLKFSEHNVSFVQYLIECKSIILPLAFSRSRCLYIVICHTSRSD